jgi:hypothetical protein
MSTDVKDVMTAAVVVLMVALALGLILWEN